MWAGMTTAGPGGRALRKNCSRSSLEQVGINFSPSLQLLDWLYIPIRHRKLLAEAGGRTLRESCNRSSVALVFSSALHFYKRYRLSSGMSAEMFCCGVMRVRTQGELQERVIWGSVGGLQASSGSSLTIGFASASSKYLDGLRIFS
jgi:hypothetical protein